MKQFKLLLSGILLLTIGYAYGQAELKKSEVIIAGKIENPKDRTIRFLNLELPGRKQYSIKINKDGSFHAMIHVLSAHDNFIQYNNAMVRVFTEPNDSLYFTADSENFEHTIQFSGDNASSNMALQKFSTEFGSLISSEGLFKIIAIPDPVEFKASIIEFFKKLDAKIELIGREHPKNERIVKWMYAYSKYRLGEELYEYGRRSKNPLSKNYYDFVDEHFNNLQASDFYCSQYYWDFMPEYYTHKFSKHKEWEIIREYSRNRNDNAALKMMFDMASEKETIDSGIELYLTSAYYGKIGRGDHNSMDTLFEAFSKIVTNRSLQSFIKQEINERRFNENKFTLDDLAALEFAGEIFSEIKEKHQGQVLYIDFWGTWCGPCLMEFPYSSALHDELSNEEVAFVYLAANSKKENWQKTIAKYNLDGTHYLLNSDQYNMLAAEFISTGFPQYMIINKEGIIVSRNASRPSEKMTKSTLTSLANE